MSWVRHCFAIYLFQWMQKYKHKLHILGKNMDRDCGQILYEFMEVVCLSGHEQGQEYEQRTILCYS